MLYNASTEPGGKSSHASITINHEILWFIGASLGLLLLVIGKAISSSNVVYAGMFIFPFSMLMGGLLEKNLWLKIVMIIIGGLFIIAAFASTGLLTSLLT